jgi:hypothetical protein
MQEVRGWWAPRRRRRGCGIVMQMIAKPVWVEGSDGQGRKTSRIRKEGVFTSLCLLPPHLLKIISDWIYASPEWDSKLGGGDFIPPPPPSGKVGTLSQAGTTLAEVETFFFHTARQKKVV